MFVAPRPLNVIPYVEGDKFLNSSELTAQRPCRSQQQVTLVPASVERFLRNRQNWATGGELHADKFGKGYDESNDDQLVASGAISLVSFVPVPNDLNPTIGYLHSMYTEKGYRGRGYARRIIEQAIQYCTASGISRVVLNASEAGKSLYEKLGFVSSPETMRLSLPLT